MRAYANRQNRLPGSGETPRPSPRRSQAHVAARIAPGAIQCKSTAVAAGDLDEQAFGGQPLPAPVAEDMGRRFGHHFRDVRVHADDAADSAARGVGASAYTLGRDIVFARGAFQPATDGGRRLLAHELAHVVQQRGARSVAPWTLGPPADAAEREADRAAGAALAGEPVRVTPAGVAVVARQQAPAPASPWSALPQALTATLTQSLDDRRAGVAGSTRNLDNAFWGNRNPADLPAALDTIGAMNVNTIVQVYERTGPSGFPWPQIRYVQNIWTGTSRGFDFVAADATALTAALNAGARFCRDSNIGGSRHSGTCWREAASSTEGLHACVNPGGSGGIHIDWHHPVSGRAADGTCSYSALGALSHWSDVGMLSNARREYQDLSPFEIVAGVGQPILRDEVLARFERGCGGLSGDRDDACVAERRERAQPTLQEIDQLFTRLRAQFTDADLRRMAAAGAAGENELRGRLAQGIPRYILWRLDTIRQGE